MTKTEFEKIKQQRDKLRATYSRTMKKLKQLNKQVVAGEVLFPPTSGLWPNHMQRIRTYGIRKFGAATREKFLKGGMELGYPVTEGWFVQKVVNLNSNGTFKLDRQAIHESLTRTLGKNDVWDVIPSPIENRGWRKYKCIYCRYTWEMPLVDHRIYLPIVCPCSGRVTGWGAESTSHRSDESLTLDDVANFAGNLRKFYPGEFKRNYYQ